MKASIALIAGFVACAIPPHAYARWTGNHFHAFRSYADYPAPGMYLPHGPDAVVDVVMACPKSKGPAGEIVLPAGTSKSLYVVPDSEGPVFQPVSLSLVQDYAHAPEAIMFRLRVADRALDGFIRPDSQTMNVSFQAPGCAHPWNVRLSSQRLKDMYEPGSMKHYGLNLVPLPGEPGSGR